MINHFQWFTKPSLWNITSLRILLFVFLYHPQHHAYSKMGLRMHCLWPPLAWMAANWGQQIDIKVNQDVLLSLTQKGHIDNPSHVLPAQRSPLTQAGHSHWLPTALAGVLLGRLHLWTALFVSRVHAEKSHELTLKWDCQNVLGNWAAKTELSNSLPPVFKPTSLRVNPPVYPASSPLNLIIRRKPKTHWLKRLKTKTKKRQKSST